MSLLYKDFVKYLLFSKSILDYCHNVDTGTTYLGGFGTIQPDSTFGCVSAERSWKLASAAGLCRIQRSTMPIFDALGGDLAGALPAFSAYLFEPEHYKRPIFFGMVSCIIPLSSLSDRYCFAQAQVSTCPRT